MTQVGHRWLVTLIAFVGVLAAMASAAGVFLRGDLATIPYVTLRGEHVDLLTGGVYRYNGLKIASEGVGWDAVTLFLVVPALALMLPGLWHGSLRAKLVVTGILAYFLYQYVEYAAFLAYGPLFLLYVATFALSLTGIILLVATINLAEAGARFSPRFPRRVMVGLSLFMALLLTAMWLPLVARTAGGDIGEALDGATTLVVQALDLGFLVPLALFTAVTVWRRMPVGYLLSSVVVVKAVAMATAIAAMLLFEASTTGELALVPLAIFALTALVGGAIALRVYGSIDADPAERRNLADAPPAKTHPAR